MPYKDPDVARQKQREYRKKNKERIKLRDKKYYQKNKHIINEKNKDYQLNYHIENPHVKTISTWKRRGIKLRTNEDWESVYLFYITCENCEECNIQLKSGQGTNCRTLDHDHSTGFIRDILCNACNIRRK